MTEKEIIQADAARQTRPQLEKESPLLCPRCGAPLQVCDCENRWENEGGATPPLRQSKDPG